MSQADFVRMSRMEDEMKAMRARLAELDELRVSLGEARKEIVRLFEQVNELKRTRKVA